MPSLQTGHKQSRVEKSFQDLLLGRKVEGYEIAEDRPRRWNELTCLWRGNHAKSKTISKSKARLSWEAYPLRCNGISNSTAAKQWRYLGWSGLEYNANNCKYSNAAGLAVKKPSTGIRNRRRAGLKKSELFETAGRTNSTVEFAAEGHSSQYYAK